MTSSSSPPALFGRLPDGREAHRIVLGAAPGPVVHLLDLGATVQRLEVTGAGGRRRNVVLGRRDVADHLGLGGRLGVTIGRYANRIAGGRLPLPGGEVALATGADGNSTHGGPEGFDRRLWSIEETGDDHAVLSLVSPDGDQGFPGTLHVKLTVEVGSEPATTPDETGEAGWVRLTYSATTDAPTVVNLTSHTYVRLDGPGRGTDAHLLHVDADSYLPVDGSGIPLGDPAPVTGTPFDLRSPTPIGEATRTAHDQVVAAGGLDHCLVLNGTSGRPAASVTSLDSGLRAELWTDQPGVQVYSANKLDGSTRAADGTLLRAGDGIALEPQHLPDSPNHPRWPSPRLDPGATYRHRSTWRFARLAD